ncbi:MAG: TonB-dependent receptor [Vicinamibacteria bacterium]|nr:TonB-dependent receptor [Vicinamibacteria bacterium]
MRVWIALVLGLLAPSALALDGVVLLPEGSPAADATISVLGRAGSTRSGAAGEFRLVPDPVPPFEVLVVLQGGLVAAPVLVEVLPTSGPLTIKLRSLVSESVTVDSGSTPFTEAPPANAGTMVGRQDLEQRRPETLAEAVEALPGVSRIDEGHTSVPAIRGLARGRTLILIDGQRVTAERRAGPSATFLDPFFLEGIEVSRGPGAVAYGSDAFGGVIHARTRQAAPGTPLEGRLEAAAGAGVPERGLAGQLSRGFEQGGAILQARWRQSGDYRTPEGDAVNSSFEDYGARLRLDHEVGPGRLGVALQFDRGRDTGKPGLDALTQPTSYPVEDSDRFTLVYEGDPRGVFSRWGASAFFGRYRLLTERERLPTATAAREVAASDVDARDWGLRASGSSAIGGFRVEGGLDFSGRFDLQATGSVQHYSLADEPTTVTEEQAIEEAGRRDLGAFVAIDGRLARFAGVTAGGRLDFVDAHNSGGFYGDDQQSHEAASGFASLLLGPWFGTTATVQAATGFRDPTLSDRYFRGIGGRGFVIGNPALEPERARQFDLALRHTGRVRASLYLYHYTIEDLVERYRVGSDFRFRNRGEAILRGAELELQADLGETTTLELAAQAARGETEDGAPVADTPAESLSATLRQRLGERGDVYARATWRADDPDFGPTEISLDGAFTLEAGGSWRFAEQLQARLTLKNLLDQAYRQTADENAALAPGFTALLSLSARF